MQFTIDQEEFQKVLNLTARLAGQKSTLVILSNILFEAEKGKVKISATNLQEAVVLEVGAQVTKEGSAAVPAKPIWEFVSSLAPKPVKVALKDSVFSVSQEKFEASFNTADTKEFPAIPKTGQGTKIQFLPQDFKKALEKVYFAAAQEEGRPVLTGVLCSFRKNKVDFIATDGYRLSFDSLGLKTEPDSKKTIIPAKALLEVVKIITDFSPKELYLEISKEGNQVIFKIDEFEFVTRLIDGEFPSWERIVPQSNKTKAEVSKEEFQQAVKVASVFARDAGNVIKVLVSDSKISFGANTKEVGSQKGEIKAQVKGPGGEIAFNYRYLLELLGVIEGEKFTLEINEPLNPGVFRDGKNKDFFHLIMPVRVQS